MLKLKAFFFVNCYGMKKCKGDEWCPWWAQGGSQIIIVLSENKYGVSEKSNGVPR